MNDLLCDSLAAGNVSIQLDALEFLSDCDHWELKIITDTMRALKENLRKTPPPREDDC